ncbi:MAG: M64 family metallopeptidase [Nanoarchaeota archaeon]|nr:M64 family metallopeptidase [Nanoarchaeota archaeon]
MEPFRKEKKPIHRVLILILVVVILLVAVSYTFETNVPASCTNVFVNGDLSNVDVVFLANNYESVLDFKSDVNSYIDRNGLHNGLLSIDPFKSNAFRFNFYLVEELFDLECFTGKDYLLCNHRKVKSIASACPHDYVIVLSKHSVFDDSAFLRSSAYLDMATLNTADNRLVLAHEFGHLFGDLADEYITGEYYVDAPNCDVVTCPKWYGLFDDVGCFQGCTAINMYRPTENSIMRDYSQTNSYGPLNENVLLRKLL